MDSTGDSHGSECTTGSGAMMLLDPCLLLAPATWAVSWDVMEVNEGLSPWSLQLCPFPPPHLPSSWSPRRGLGCLLQASIAVGLCAPTPPCHSPTTHHCVQAGACGELEGRLCHMEPGALGTAGAWGWVPWPWGQPPESSTPDTHWAVGWKATGQACVLCMSQLELL